MFEKVRSVSSLIITFIVFQVISTQSAISIDFIHVSIFYGIYIVAANVLRC